MKKLLQITLAQFVLLVVSSSAYSQALVSDTLFGNNGQIFSAPYPSSNSSTSSEILRQSDDKLLLCGYIYDINCNCNYNVMFRTDCSGAIDSSFGVNGLVQHTFDQRNAGIDYELQPDGKILVAGTQADGNASSQQFPSISRYNIDGSVDSSFGVAGTNKVTLFTGAASFYSLFLQPDGKILCSGQVGRSNHLLMRFDSTGVLDTTFGTGGYIQHATPAGMSLLNGFSSVARSDNKIVSVTSGFFDQVVVLGCYDMDGVEDSTFGVNGYYSDVNFVINGGGTGIPRLIIQSDDKVIASKQNGPETEIIIARYNTNGSVDTTFGTGGYIRIPGFRLENLFKLSGDDFIVGFSVQGMPSNYKKFSADGVEDLTFTLNGANYFQFTGLATADVGLASSNDEFILGSSSGSMEMAKFVENSSGPVITNVGFVLYSNVTATGATFQWYLNEVAISGATADTLEISQNGVYSVDVFNSWGCVLSNELEILTIGIDESISSSEHVVYPNPVEQILNIRNSGSKLRTYSVFDLSGKLVSTQTSNALQLGIDVSALSDGMYVLKINSEEKVFQQLFVKD